jgi:LysM repeat protein
VKSGETLYSIAKKYQTTIDKLRALNRLVGNTLKVGARLVISTPQSVNAQQQ